LSSHRSCRASNKPTSVIKMHCSGLRALSLGAAGLSVRDEGSESQLLWMLAHDRQIHFCLSMHMSHIVAGYKSTDLRLGVKHDSVTNLWRDKLWHIRPDPSQMSFNRPTQVDEQKLRFRNYARLPGGRNEITQILRAAFRCSGFTKVALWVTSLCSMLYYWGTPRNARSNLNYNERTRMLMVDVLTSSLFRPLMPSNFFRLVRSKKKKKGAW
jgi:hypothetical protein